MFGGSSIGVCHPKGPDHFEFWRWILVDTAAPAEVKAAMSRCFHVWPLGMADPDDGESWSGIQTSMAGPVYPGTVTPQPVGEGPQRAFYRRWLEFMTSDAWPHIWLLLAVSGTQRWEPDTPSNSTTAYPARLSSFAQLRNAGKSGSTTKRSR